MSELWICRDCLTRAAGPRPRRCPSCHAPRLLAHGELGALSIAHIDCDAFYASVEKLDDPGLADRPVIIGGGRRGVASTACYVARIAGVRSAMPMFRALQLCPDAVVLKPRMERYVEVSRAIRARFEAVAPEVEPLSLDEAFLDLTGTERLHGAPPAAVLARLAREIEGEIGVTVSVGLSHNKFLAKIASDLDKPRGFSVIGRAETGAFLADQKVGIIWGVGAAMREKLAAKGVRTIADLLRWEKADLIAAFGSMGARLYHLARGEDRRAISSRSPMKSISAETTFDVDIADAELISAHLWRLAVRVSDRAKAKEMQGRVVNVKLKTADFRTLTRRRALSAPTQLADEIWRAAAPLAEREIARGPFRLAGVGLSDFTAEGSAADLLDPSAAIRARAERATDAIRNRFGPDSIAKGRGLKRG